MNFANIVQQYEQENGLKLEKEFVDAVRNELHFLLTEGLIQTAKYHSKPFKDDRVGFIKSMLKKKSESREQRCS